MNIRHIVKSLGLALLCIALCGCDESVRGKLSETQANELLATLAQYRILATRQEDQDGTWRVSVPPGQRELATEILKTYEMPQAVHPNMSDVFPKEGFMSSPVEERARYQYGLAQELAQTIERMEGVVLARVHVAVPNREFAKDTGDKPASASVFVKYRSDISMVGREEEIRELVTNSLGDGAPEKVSVMMMPVTPTLVSPQSRLQGGWMGLLYRDQDRSAVLLFVGLPWCIVLVWLAVKLASLEQAQALLYRLRRAKPGGAPARGSYYQAPAPATVAAGSGGSRDADPARQPPPAA
jgi:type III secretion protein J